MDRKHRNIMILGTGSNVGKSIINTGLCRIFYQDGFSVSPFKSQNMALNSFITKDGKEMGRAQVVQAEAANIEPEVFMNPILLKPTTDRKSQVIVNGKIFKNMDAREYFAYKHNLKGEIMKAYEHIRKNFDICVLEGAGSPAEINLKEDDIVNTGMAEMADAPVILVADIDRGGVFAAIYGTIMLLEESERKRIKGVIINKFRGDKSLLTPGIEMIENLTNVPVLGVIPYVKLGIEEEDSLGIDKYKQKKDAKIKISVIRLKRVSNFTDIDALAHYEDVSIKYVEKASELGDEDMIIIPGSKNTVEDMKDLIEKDISRQIVRLARTGTFVFGICGGFQMLGQKISDPQEMESNLKEISGEIKVKGYEIHQGYSYPIEEKISENKEMSEDSIKCIFGDEKIKGIVKNNIIGTYLHGIFDNSEFTNYLLNAIRRKKGVDELSENFSFAEYKNNEYDKLAKILRENLDMKKIYEIMDGE